MLLPLAPLDANAPMADRCIRSDAQAYPIRYWAPLQSDTGIDFDVNFLSDGCGWSGEGLDRTCRNICGTKKCRVSCEGADVADDVGRKQKAAC